ncbi:hypothetical protein HYFRA_00006201 [Hymenoscyphus fraxineus]|uniref:ATPase synthesis protein 25 n=1 Tax=Hymenoscyphus fraxineus TaxID=746836 RepID=A0A9N9L8Y6_9HELO|nr:hypothetical protein HYFRA_00006201 [Hymenoscyphus fraxineus]
MVANRLLRATGCASCRSSLLKSSTSIGGSNIRLPQTVQRPRNYSRLSGYQARLFSQQAARRQDDKEASDQDRRVAEFLKQDDLEQEELERSEKQALEEQDGFENDVLEDELEESTESIESADGPQKISAVPWYLQVKYPEKAINPLSERQRIPDLPINPPPILDPLLKTVSLHLGIDDLTLIDLRKLDPPPALGANLIMIIGTARSEKHLHVSADRLCRWLRSNYKLRPNADGLLGRNELKLKLKRKAKRSKLMGRVQDENADDGIRTGWVCVDVGVVEGAEDSEPVVENKNFVGFGRKTDGVRLVLQMLTEQKREEMELERLWQGILHRATQPVVEDGGEDVITEGAGEGSIISSPAITTSTARLSSGTTSPGPTKREYHTSARRLQTALVKNNTSTSNLEGSIGNDTISDPNILYNSISDSMAAGQYEKARTTLLDASDHIKELTGKDWRANFQELLFSNAQSLSVEEARECLGSGPADYSSTPFLTSFYGSLTTLPTAAEVEARVWLYSWAQSVGHPGYKASGLKDLFSELRTSGAEISLPAYKQILRGLLTPEPRQDGTLATSESALVGCTKVLKSMHNRGFQILDEDLLVELQEAATIPMPEDISNLELQESTDTYHLPSTPATPIQRRLHLLMMSLDLPCFRDETRLRLLNLYRAQNNWLEFWDTWRMAPKRGVAQSPVLYAFMFGSVAQTRHQNGCMNVLRTWTPEMDLEDPPVLKEGQVAKAMRACIKIVDPFVEEAHNAESEAKNEWVRLWRKCQPEKGEQALLSG